jgi:XTP/dITP diphosphohydrolase
MTRIIFATTNSGKLKEVNKLLNIPTVSLIKLEALKNQPIPEVEETGSTFHENALIKARAYYSIFQQPVIADDSGLTVPELNNEPGVYSARYAGPHASDNENNALLVKKIAGLPIEKRKAFFHCVTVYKDDNHEEIFEGKCYGRILEKPIGTNGFGYDPLFFIDELNKTFAQLGTEEKNQISHRGKAVNLLSEYLKKMI